MPQRLWIVPAAVCLLALPATARAQDFAVIPADVFADLPDDKAHTTRPEAGASNPAARLQKIQQLTFDRRPSTVLKEWAAADRDTARNRPSVKGKPTPPPDPFDEELSAFQRLVTRADWPAVRAFLLKRPVDEAKALYARLVEALPTPPQDAAVPEMQPSATQVDTPVNAVEMSLTVPSPAIQVQQNPQFAEKNTITGADVIGIACAAPKGLDGDLIAGLGKLLRASIDQGNAVDDVLARAHSGLNAGPKSFPISRREIAKILAAADCSAETGAFLPDARDAERTNDREALNLLSRHFSALYVKDKNAAHLEDAWKVTQAVLAVGEVDPKEKDEALTHAVELAAKVRDELGKAWLEESFTRRPGRGMEVIAAVGSSASRGTTTHPGDSEFRKKALLLQKTAVDALLGAAPERGTEWAPQLGLLASAWLSEAEFSTQFDDSTGLAPRMQRDPYGNMFFTPDGGNGFNPNMLKAVSVADVLASRPGDAWAALLDPALKPRFAVACCQLYLKVGEAGLAFPFVERLAPTHPERARLLAEEFVRVWTRTHDPNTERNQTNPYTYMFGFERKAESIPLTRSKQQRNLRELAEWVRRVRALPVQGFDESLFSKAFTTCHGAAEVYGLDAIETVFGPPERLRPDALAALADQTRNNLATLWRQPAFQEQNKTRRKEKDIRAEVVRGYGVARELVARGLKAYPESWEIALADASLAHDENNYRQEIEPSLGFSKARRDAFARFARAAALYSKKVATLREEEETARPFEQWFYASLGACDIPLIDEKSTPDASQPALIRRAILNLPAPSGDRHLGLFANDLFSHMSGLNPAVKFRYLRNGFEIVGDHANAREARKVFDYYKDLVTEIKLDAAVDGPTTVGHGRPFGVLVGIRHTREIERESGGFGRYLQNQNAGNGQFSYNFGRPLENYRDRFKEAATRALQEHFHVLSVTFEDDKVLSRATPEDGWRFTPYAYIALKARGPEVDKIPPLVLDFDFLDTSGYIVLPVESPLVPIDAAPDSPPARPFEKMVITQTLDERPAKSGKLVLEVKAVTRGMVPEFDQLLQLRSPGFHVSKMDDQGVSVSRFDPDSDTPAVLSDRSWLITLQADNGQAKPASTFRFASPRVEGAEMMYQRYVDADLARVGPVLTLNERYGSPSRAWMIWATLGVAAVAVLAFASWKFRPRAAIVPAPRFRVPEPLTPFSVLGLLRDIQHNDGLDDTARHDLAASIHRVERHYFAEPSEGPLDLRAIASDWVGRV